MSLDMFIPMRISECSVGELLDNMLKKRWHLTRFFKFSAITLFMEQGYAENMFYKIPGGG